MAIKAFQNPSSKKKEEDQGFLAGALGNVAALNLNYSPVGVARRLLGQGEILGTEDATKQARGITDMLNPATLLPALGQAGIQQIKAVPTLATAAGGALLGKSNEEILNLMDVSPASFALDSGNIRQQLAQGAEGGAANNIMAGVGMASPVLKNVAESFASTGIRAATVPAAAVTQTGLVGPKRTPNEILEANAPGVESYAQAGERGGAGALLLGDILNVAPGLKGATGGGALNPLAETAAAQKVANFGAALERAPLAPVSAPGQAWLKAVDQATYGAKAFPKLAAAAEKAPVGGSVLSAPERLAQFAGKKAAGFEQRAEVIKQTGELNAEIRNEVDDMAAQIKQAEKAGNQELADTISVERDMVIKDAKREAINEAIYQFNKRAAVKAEKYGAETQGTTAYGQVIDPETGQIASGNKYDVQEGLPRTASIEGKTAAEEFPKANVEAYLDKRAEVLAAHPDMNPDSILQADTYSTARQALVKKYPEIDALHKQGKALPLEDKVPLEMVRQLPENFTEKMIEANLKGLDTPALPKDPFAKAAVQGFDKMMSLWKTTVLPVRPAWHATNLTGNALGALTMGEVELGWASKNFGKIARDLKEGTIDPGLQPAIGRGLSKESLGMEIDSLKGTKFRELAKDKDVRGLGRKTIETSYTGAQSVDDFTHYAVAKNRLEKNLAKDMSREAAYADANAFALKTMGDFGNMSGFERAWLRRAMPFYPWTKHTAKATLRYPVENPGRFLQQQMLAERIAPGGSKEPEGGGFLGGYIPMGGGKFFKLGGDIGLGFDNPLLNPTKLGGALAPPLQMAGAAMGLNLARGRELSTNPNQGRQSQITGYLTNMSPTSKLAAEMFDYARGEGDLRRDDTRGVMVAKGRPVLDTSEGLPGVPAPILPFVSGSAITTADLKEMATLSKKKAKTEAKAAKTYAKAVKKSPKKK